MMNINKILTLALITCFVGCSTNKQATPPPPEKKKFEKMMQAKADLTAKGIPAAFVTTTSQELQIGIDKAEVECRGQLARAMEAKVGSMQKQFEEVAGKELAAHFEQATKTISSRVLSGTTMTKVEYDEVDGMYRIYGLMIMDPKVFKDALLAELQAQEATKIKVMASKGYKELENETQAFDNYKKESQE